MTLATIIIVDYSSIQAAAVFDIRDCGCTRWIFSMFNIWSYGHFRSFGLVIWLGHRVKNIRPSGFYLFGRPVSASWTHLEKVNQKGYI